MRLYIGNCTQQIVELPYRVIESAGVRFQKIGIGQQTPISGDLNQPQVDYIIEQLSKYGLMEFSEVKSTRGHVGLVYSVDKPIPSITLEYGMRQNKNVLINKGKETRKLAAVAINNAIETNLAENELANLDKLEVSIVEEDNPRGNTVDEDTGSRTIAEAVRVTRNEAPSDTSTRQNRQQRRGNKKRGVG